MPKSKTKWIYVKILKIYAIPEHIINKAETLKPGFWKCFRTVNGQTRLSWIRFKMIRTTFYIVRSCPQLWGVPKFIRTVIVEIECRQKWVFDGFLHMSKIYPTPYIPKMSTNQKTKSTPYTFVGGLGTILATIAFI